MIRGKITVATELTRRPERQSSGLGWTIETRGYRKEAINATLRWQGGNPPLLDLRQPESDWPDWRVLRILEVGWSHSVWRSNRLFASISSDLNRSGNRNGRNDADHGETTGVHFGKTAAAPHGTSAGDRTIYTHNLWLNYLKPVSLGLVVSPTPCASPRWICRSSRPRPRTPCSA